MIRSQGESPCIVNINVFTYMWIYSVRLRAVVLYATCGLTKVSKFNTQPRDMSSSIRPLVVSGPSGSGKSTLLTKLFEEFKGCFAFSISHTTRKPRPGETNGVEYHFVSKEEFQKLVADNGFLEHAEFSGNCYGTSKKSVMDITHSGLMCVLDVEVNGVKNIKKSNLQPCPRYVFIKPPSLEVLKSRLDSRGTETAESLQKRLDSAKEALDYANEPGAYDHVITNDDLQEAYEQFKQILIEDLHAIQSRLQKKGN